MQLKHYSASTIKDYISQVVLSAGYLGKSPAQASLGEAVRYLLHLINDKGGIAVLRERGLQRDQSAVGRRAC